MNLTHHILPIMALCLLCEYTLFADNGIVDEEKNSSKLYDVSSLNHDKQLNKLFDKQVHATVSYFETYDSKVTQDELNTRRQIDATLSKVVAENRFVQFLDANAVIDLPIGIKSEIGNLTYIILIDSLILTPGGAFLFASMAFDAPKIGRMHFRSAGIQFSKTGGIADVGVLELVGDYGIDISKTQRLMLNGNRQQTFVEVDCYGFRQMSLDASLVLSREKFLPEDNTGKVIPDQNVALNFKTILSDWNDLLVAVDVPRFQVVGLKGFSFEVRQAVLDLSDIRNAPQVVFPQNYRSYSPFLRSGNPNLWQGVYLAQVSVFLPPQFKTTDNQRPTLNGYHLLIDEEGFSGIISAENIIPIDRGKISNWDFSLDAIDLALVASEIQAGSLTGKINIPINKIDEGLSNEEKERRFFHYTATMLPGNEYIFNVSNPESLDFDFWKADVRLDPASHILIQLRDDRFYPIANLHGEMTIQANLKDDQDPEANDEKNVTIPGIAFQELIVKTTKPYVQVGAFSFGAKTSKLGGYPIQVTRLGAGYRGDELFLDAEVALALTGNEGGNFGAAGGVRFIAQADERADDFTYKYKELELTRFAIDIDQGAFAFRGSLDFFKDDPVYAQGLHGNLNARFSQIGLGVNAIFGNKDGMRYWCTDALVDLGTGIPVVPGIYLNRFGGGASYHMRRTNTRMGSPIIPENSEIFYVPDESVALGLKAITGLRGQNEKIFHAEAMLEMNFRSTGGLKNILFMGNAFLLSAPIPRSTEYLKQKAGALGRQGDLPIQSNGITNEVFGPPDVSGAQIFGGILMNYDFDNRTLHSNLKAIINVGQGVVTGGGDAVIHFAPDDWYIYIGKPDYARRFNLNLLGIARADAYFVMGSTIPDTPPPPQNVSAILGGIDLDYMNDLNALSNGQGVGFGASLRLDTGNKTFLIFYGRFQAGLGFDVMMRDYGGVTCSGRGALGIDGWYANGQAYAYFDGNVGVQVKLFGVEKSVDILKIGAAVVAQAKLPNPVWIKGTVGGHFSVLGGLVKGKCSFEVTIGEECDIQNEGSTLEGVAVIAQLTPQEGLNDVDVFTAPQAVFNYEMETDYQMLDLNNQPVDFRIALDKMELMGPSGPLHVALKWNEARTVAVLQTDEMLPEHTQLEFSVTASLQEKQNGTWRQSQTNGDPLSETRSITFTTGEAPDYISPNNVAYSYPSHNMLNLYRNEHPKGYIKLIRGQDYLFEDPAFTPIVRFTSGNEVMETPLVYDNTRNQLEFSLANLQLGAIYQLTIVNVPQLQNSIEGNVMETEQKIALVDASITSRQATGSITNYEEQQLFQSAFRTSIHNTFEEKIKSMQLSSGWRWPVSAGVHILGANFGGQEPFSNEEMLGDSGSDPMIRMEADLTRNTWFYGKVNPLLYEKYPLPGGILIQPSVRDVNQLGLIPVRAVRFTQDPSDFKLSGERHLIPSFGSFGGTMRYELAHFMNQDFRNLKNQAANYIFRTGSAENILTRLIQSPFPSVEKGHYLVDISYYLPGQDQPNTTYRHSIFNPLN